MKGQLASLPVHRWRHTGRRRAPRAGCGWDPACLRGTCCRLALPSSRVWARNAGFSFPSCAPYPPVGPFRPTLLPSLPCPGKTEKPCLHSSCRHLLLTAAVLTLLLGDQPRLAAPLLLTRSSLLHDPSSGSRNCSFPSSLWPRCAGSPEVPAVSTALCGSPPQHLGKQFSVNTLL